MLASNRLTDKHEICYNLGKVYKNPRNVSKKLQKDIPSRTGNTSIFVQFQKGSRPTNRLTDIQEIWNKLEIVQKNPGNITNNFRKIMPPELEISQYLCNFSKKVSQVTD